MIPEFFQKASVMAVGSRLRRFSDMVTLDSRAIFELQGMDFEPRWFPLFYMLSDAGPLHVTDLAQRIGQSHASVSQLAKEMEKEGLVSRVRDAQDGRKSLLSLTTIAQKLASQMDDLYEDVYQSVADFLQETDHHFWAALEDLEEALERKSLLKRVQEARKIRLANDIQIVDYEPQYAAAFRDINVEWIQQNFTMEEADYKALDNPDTYILDKGGYIFMALLKGQPVGAVAMIKMETDCYELAKMGVSSLARGRGVGYLLGLAVIEKARSLDTKRLYLESNTKLAPAISLYYKLGFQKMTTKVPTPYARSNIQMELFLEKFD